MTVRLPTVGGEPDPAFQEAIPGVTPVPWGQRGRPLLCVAGASASLPMVPLARDMVRALAREGWRVAALRTRRRAGPAQVEARGADAPDGRTLAEAGAEPVVVVRTDSLHAAEGVREGLAVLAQGEGPVVCVGNDVPALHRTALTVLLTGSRPPSAWAESARALWGRVDLELPEPRPGLAEALIRAWSTTVAASRPSP